MSGLSALRSWKSAGSSSASAEHKTTPKSSTLSFSAKANFALCRALKICEFSCWSCWWSLRVLEGREGKIREKSITFELCWGEGCLEGDFFSFEWSCYGEERWGIAFCDARRDFGGGSCDMTFSIVGLEWVQNFFAWFSPPSLLFRFTVVSISDCSSSVLFFFLFLLVF